MREHQPMVTVYNLVVWVGGLGFLGSPKMKGIVIVTQPLESQTTNPYHQVTIH